MLNKEEIQALLDGLATSVLEDPDYAREPYKVLAFEDMEGRVTTREWYGELDGVGSFFIEPIVTEHYQTSTTDEIKGKQSPAIKYRMVAMLTHEGKGLCAYYDEISRG